MPRNWCFWTVVLEKTLYCPLDYKEIKPINPKCNQPWLFIWRIFLKLQYFDYLMQRADSLESPQSWERLKAGGKGDNRGWDGWMASQTHWIWVWVSSGRWWRTGKPGVLQSMGSQRVRHDWVIEQQQLSLLNISLNNRNFENESQKNSCMLSTRNPLWIHRNV